MKHLKSILGYTVAVITIFVALAAFMGNTDLSKVLISKTGLSIAPIYTGGEIVKTIDHDGYQTDIHQAVFPGLISEGKEGFLQIDWIKKTKIPEEIVEDIDFDSDKQIDFMVNYDTVNNEASIKTNNPRVIDVSGVYRRKNGFTIRVSLKK